MEVEQFNEMFGLLLTSQGQEPSIREERPHKTPKHNHGKGGGKLNGNQGSGSTNNHKREDAEDLIQSLVRLVSRREDNIQILRVSHAWVWFMNNNAPNPLLKTLFNMASKWKSEIQRGTLNQRVSLRVVIFSGDATDVHDGSHRGYKDRRIQEERGKEWMAESRSMDTSTVECRQQMPAGRRAENPASATRANRLHPGVDGGDQGRGGPDTFPLHATAHQQHVLRDSRIPHGTGSTLSSSQQSIRNPRDIARSSIPAITTGTSEEGHAKEERTETPSVLATLSLRLNNQTNICCLNAIILAVTWCVL